MYLSSAVRGFLSLLFILMGTGHLISEEGSDPLVFRRGDRWVAVGDSITHTGSYYRIIQLFYATRFPEQPFDCQNKGIGGDTASGVLTRMEWDVLPNRPTVATVMLGMNDFSTVATTEAMEEKALAEKAKPVLDRYRSKIHEIFDCLSKNGTRVIVLTPSPYDETVQSEKPPLLGRNRILSWASDLLIEDAKEKKWAWVDFHTPLNENSITFQKKDPQYTIIGKDRVHPGFEGNALMALTFLQTFKAPALVSSMELDAASMKMVSTQRAEVSNLRGSAQELRFTSLEKSFPFPIKVDQEKFGFSFQELNREILKISGLEEGVYKVSVDGTTYGEVTAEQLGKGINLADWEKLPNYQQALEASDLQRKQHQAQEKLRMIAWSEFQLYKKKQLSFDEMSFKQKSAEFLKNAESKPWFPYLKSQMDQYEGVKKQEDQWIEEERHYSKAFWEKLTPRSHEWLIQKKVPSA